MEARSAVTVNASPELVHARWRDFERLPEFMDHVRSVRPAGEGRWHWVVKGPAGTSVEWDAELTDEVPGERLAWRSVGDASVDSAGSVRFCPAPRGQGTEVRVELSYAPPLGAVGALVAKLFGEEPNQQLGEDLRRFKQLVETGEIARSDGSPEGTRARNLFHRHDARPAGVGA